MREDGKKRYRTILIIALMVTGLLTVDYAIGYKQNKILEEKKALRKKIERLAYYLERTDISEVIYAGKEKYIMKLRYENVHPEDEMWIWIHSIRVFVQRGTLWKELSVNDMRLDRNAYIIERLKEPLHMAVIFENPGAYEELMAGYMHLKVNSISYIMAEAVAKEDVIEKSEDIFIYVSTDKKKGRVKTLLR